MDNMKEQLLWQIMQNIGGATDEMPGNAMQDNIHHELTPEWPPSWDAIMMFYPMLPPHEQRIIDLVVKLQEVQDLVAEI